MKIGEKLRTLRKERKLTQERLAEYLNVSSQAVSKWENGLASPDIDMLPRLAVFYDITMDELLDFDRCRTDREVETLVQESIPLRDEPEKAEAFYRKALEQYPNNEVLLNCLLMVLPNEQLQEKLKIGQQLLDCSTDDEVRHDVCRILAEACQLSGENLLAEHYLEKLPELYFLKTEIAALVRKGDAQLTEIRKTENVCFRILSTMLALRMHRDSESLYRDIATELLNLYSALDSDHLEHAGHLKEMLEKWQEPPLSVWA